MEVTPAIRTASRAFYLAYLNSPAWRTRRNRALQRANFKCSACGTGRDLQVHHLTYERLGAELDSDLQVRCFECHREGHLEEGQTTELGVYLKLGRQVLNDAPMAPIADLAEGLKIACAKHKISYQAHQVDKAISLLTGARPSTPKKPYVSVADVPPDQPLTAEQAKEFFIRTGFNTVGLIKTMPKPLMISQREADQRKAMEIIARAMQESIDRCAELEREVEGHE